MNLGRVQGPVKIVDVENIGTVWIKKNNRSRSIRISVSPYEPVTVTVPRRISLKDSIEALKQKEKWIVYQLDKISRLYKKPGIFNENTKFRTLDHTLRIEKGKVSECRARKKDSRLVITYPENLHIENVQVQNFIQRAITGTLRIEAAKYLPKRVLDLATEHRFNYRKVFIKNSKSRWGSCSSVNNINLNLHLVLLPSELSDYVILHELVHTVEKNHGKNFWEKLDTLTGDAKKLRKQLSMYNHFLYGLYPENS